MRKVLAKLPYDFGNPILKKRLCQLEITAPAATSGTLSVAVMKVRADASRCARHADRGRVAQGKR